MNEAMLKQSRRVVTQLVWTITLLGLAAGIFMLSMVYWTIGKIHSEREKFNALQATLTRMVTSLDAYLDQGRDDIKSLLSGEDRPSSDAQWASHLDELVLRFRRLQLTGDHESGAALDRLDRQLSDLKNLRTACQAWGMEMDQMHSIFSLARREAESSLSQLRAAIISLEGRQRLQRAIQIQQYRQASGKHVNRLAHQIIADMSRGTEISAIKTESADLALLSERLLREDQIDNLADLKDNQFKPTLDRLHLGIRLLEGRKALAEKLPPDLLKRFETNLFGQDFTVDDIHQTIVPGQGGLYLLCRSRLSLAVQREALQKRIDQLLADLGTTREMLVRSAEWIANRTAQNAELALKRSWKTMLAVLMVIFSLFLGLSLKITQDVKRQIKAIERTNENLTSEISERQKIEAALRQSEEALRASRHELEMRVEERTSELKDANQLLAKEVSERKRAEEQLRHRGQELSKALQADRRSRRMAEAERDKSRNMLAEVTESKRRLEILISDATAREMAMVELKREINGLLVDLGREMKYAAPQKVDQIMNRRRPETPADVPGDAESAL